MGRRWIFTFGFLALNGYVAYASGDFSCGPPRGTIFFRGYSTCNSVPFLSPSNDSRLNLQLLLIDSGKLAGTLNMSQDYPLARDVAFLRVPFDLGNWQVNDPRSNATQTGSANGSTSNDYAQGEGSRCANAKVGAEAFRNAVTAASLPTEEASILITARTSLVPGCGSTAVDDWKVPEGIYSPVGKDFLIYAAGASAFYNGEYVEALKNFKSLNQSANPWLKETSRYMVGRTLLNSAQRQAFGEWGDLQLKNVINEDLKGAEDAFNAYLQDFPSGTYAASARGLLRRVYWLGGDQSRLAEAYDNAFADSPKGNVTLSELVQESDQKLLGSVEINSIKSPQFLAIVDLMRMRSGSDDNPVAKGTPALTLADLEAQQQRFANRPALYGYLLAAFHVFVDNKPEQALALLPSMPDTPLSYFSFSQQTLRALALESAKQFDEERKLLLRILPLAKLPLQSEQVQLELAKLDQRTGQVDRALAPGSPIQDKAIRMILVEYSASAPLLRQRIKDPKENADVIDAAIYTLLYKELTGGKYKDFQSDLALLPAHPSQILAPFVASGEDKSTAYHCPALSEVAAILERNRNDARSLNCVGELVRVHEVHYGQDAAPPQTDLGAGDSSFPVTNYSRMDGYLEVISDHHAESDARAYALFRAIRCYAPAGNNECGKQENPLATRKQWFQMLHREYADSVWAKSLKYYW
jgi:hypothetical protein